MNRNSHKKRLKSLNWFYEAVTKKSDFANHLLNETKNRKKNAESKLSETILKINMMNSYLDVGAKGEGFVANIYGYLLTLNQLKAQLSDDLDVIGKEYDRRFEEYKLLKIKCLGSEALIERTKKEISALDNKEESAMIDEWVLSSLTKR